MILVFTLHFYSVNCYMFMYCTVDFRRLKDYGSMYSQINLVDCSFRKSVFWISWLFWWLSCYGNTCVQFHLSFEVISAPAQLSCLFVSCSLLTTSFRTHFYPLNLPPTIWLVKWTVKRKFMVFILLNSDNIHVRNPSKMEYLLRKRN